MCKKSTTHRWGIAYLTILMALYICTGVYVNIWATETADLIVIDTSQANEVSRDWDKNQLTELIVTDWTYCPVDYPVNVLSRPFHGTTLGCDCLGVSNKWMKNNNQLIEGAYCNVN